MADKLTTRMPYSVSFSLVIMIVMSCLCVLFELADVAKNWPGWLWDADVMSKVWIVSAVGFALSVVMINLRKRWLCNVANRLRQGYGGQDVEVLPMANDQFQ